LADLPEKIFAGEFNLLGIVPYDLAKRCDFHPARGSLEQRDTKLFLQRMDVPG
jgi:hypothetical protein